jgi:hypothetical protein
MLLQKSGTVIPSYTSSLLDEIYLSGNVFPEKEEVIRDTGGVLYGGGADTVCSAVILSCQSSVLIVI